MTDRLASLYAHEAALLRIEEFGDEARVSIFPSIQFLKDADTGTLLSRCPAFPAQIGIGRTRKESEDSLEKVLTTYIKMFADENGLDIFRDRLLKIGFRPISDEAEMLGNDAKNWKPWAFQDELIPNIRLRLAC